jgi:hypothetical protein
MTAELRATAVLIAKRRSSLSIANMPPKVPHAPPNAMAAKASAVANERPERIVTEAVKIR